MTTRRARTLGWDVNKLNSFVTWMLVSAFVLSHVLDSLFYHWDEVVKNPLYVLKLWEGLSSFGGFVGAVVGIVLWRYLVIEDGRLRVRPSPQPLLPFADLVLSCLPLGWMFGRVGCASVHDHPGARDHGRQPARGGLPLPRGRRRGHQHRLHRAHSGARPALRHGPARALLHHHPHRVLRAHLARDACPSARTSSPPRCPTPRSASPWTSCATRPARTATRATRA